MKRLFLFAVFLTACVCLNAQSVQCGYVEEYNGANEKTPLAGVIVNAGGATARSGADGKFKLAFNTLKVGDRVNADVSSVANLKGYILFNKEAVEQWTVSGKSVCFRIVLCKKKQFDQLVKRYYDIGDSSYREQLRRERAMVEQLKQEGTLQVAEYEQMLKEAEERYQRAKNALNENAELVARIDESELDEEQEQILTLAKEGRIDEATLLIRESDIVAKFDKAYDKNKYSQQQREHFEHIEKEAQQERQRMSERMAFEQRVMYEALAADSNNQAAKVYLVKSYLFEGKYDEAEKIALEIKDLEFEGRLVKEIILETLKKIEDDGFVPDERKADVARLKEALKL